MDFSAARRNMVESQLRPNKVIDPRVLAAAGAVPRERFVPTALKGRAYTDESLSIAADRWIMAPMPLCRLIQEAAPQAEEHALVIGAGFGYASALLGRLCNSVFAVESDPTLVEEMGKALTELIIDNVVCVEAPLANGYPEEGPFDVILIAGGVDTVPAPFFDQLSEGGRLVAVVNDDAGIGRATLYGKRNGIATARELFDAVAKPLPGFAKKTTFML